MDNDLDFLAKIRKKKTPYIYIYIHIHLFVYMTNKYSICPDLIYDQAMHRGWVAASCFE